MSDYPTWSQRKAWNNDGMDPDWRPDHTPIETMGRKIDSLLYAARDIASVPFKEEDFKPDDWIQLKIPVRYLRSLKEALKDLEVPK